MYIILCYKMSKSTHIYRLNGHFMVSFLLTQGSSS